MRARTIVKTIAIVDDKPLDLKLVGRGLTTAGFAVKTYDSAIAFLEDAENNLPDLLITDLQMPRMTGWELCRTLETRTPPRTFPIIVLTALPEWEHRAQASTFTQLQLLEKPVSMRRLVERVQSLGRGSAADESAGA